MKMMTYHSLTVLSFSLYSFAVNSEPLQYPSAVKVVVIVYLSIQDNNSRMI
jgi:hypothetical protein